MDSDLFHLVILDGEGGILKCNRRFAKSNPAIESSVFFDFLTSGSGLELKALLGAILEVPATSRDLILDHLADGDGKPQIGWGFSLLPDSALPMVIGIGVAKDFMDQEMPWDSLAEVLEFGEIKLDKELGIISWDGRIMQWLDAEEESWIKSQLTELPAFRGMIGLREELLLASKAGTPKCFRIETTFGKKQSFAAIMTPNHQGYSLYVIPRDRPSQGNTDDEGIPESVLDAFPGAVFVLDPEGKLCKQNEAAKGLGEVWQGRAYVEGFSMTFPVQSPGFAELLRAIEDAKNGLGRDLELKFLQSGGHFQYWNVLVRPIFRGARSVTGILIQVFDMSELNPRLFQVTRENDRLRDLALSPTHILRGPLSSIIGLLELIDADKLDQENRSFFEYLKPLAKELDRTIRQHAKKMSAFD